MASGIAPSFQRALLMFLLLACIFLVLPSHASADQGIEVYSTDFSMDPGWSTNNPVTNYYDAGKGMFHYLMRDGSGAYVNVRVPYHGESFILSFDILPERTEYQSSVKFGLGDDDQVSNERLTMFTEFDNGPYGRLIWIRAIDGQNQRREASSYYLSYGGQTVQFTDGTWYHVVMDYRLDTRSLTLSVTRRNDSVSVWHYTLGTLSVFPSMNRIYMSKIGDSTNPNAVAEGYIDNVAFSVGTLPGTPQPAAVQTTPVAPGSPAAGAGQTGVPREQPSEAARKVPFPVFATLGALALLARWAGTRQRGRR